MDRAGPLDVKRRQSNRSQRHWVRLIARYPKQAQEPKPKSIFLANWLRWSSSPIADLVGRKKSIELCKRELDWLLNNPMMWGRRCYAEILKELAECAIMRRLNFPGIGKFVTRFRRGTATATLRVGVRFNRLVTVQTKKAVSVQRRPKVYQ